MQQQVLSSVTCEILLQSLYYNLDYRQITNIICSSIGSKIVDHSDIVGASPDGTALTTHLHCRLDIWLQYIAQSQLQDETGDIKDLVLGATYIGDLTVV